MKIGSARLGEALCLCFEFDSSYLNIMVYVNYIIQNTFCILLESHGKNSTPYPAQSQWWSNINGNLSVSCLQNQIIYLGPDRSVDLSSKQIAKSY